MVEVDTAALEQGLNLLVVALPSIDGVPARVVLVRRQSHHQLRTGDNFEGVGPGLKCCLQANLVQGRVRNVPGQ